MYTRAQELLAGANIAKMVITDEFINRGLSFVNTVQRKLLYETEGEKREEGGG